jgi:hypothetical protein
MIRESSDGSQGHKVGLEVVTRLAPPLPERDLSASRPSHSATMMDHVHILRG